MVRMTPNVQVALFIMSDFDPNKKVALLSCTKELLKIAFLGHHMPDRWYWATSPESK